MVARLDRHSDLSVYRLLHISRRHTEIRVMNIWRDFLEIPDSFVSSVEHISASRQDPNGVFLARTPVFRDFLFLRNLKIKR
uniref:Uncharacterized protein n=1 Tax=Candidatus Kentrum sp. TC TaxID=2126339 RepID=A0A451A153_9GAMM|nr:MAG: hypothetical protein BECKTC1821F_GA0114240_10378 [Candidatus Kentron sp. TC]